MSYWIESRRRSMSNCLAHRESVLVSVAISESYENFGGDVFGLCRRASPAFTALRVHIRCANGTFSGRALRT